KGYIFMPAEEKAKIISELRCVDEVFISIDEDQTQCKTLEYLKPHIFAKGGGQICIRNSRDSYLQKMRDTNN
ncbi:MAG: hypothetical protein Q8N63_08455, partial [Nanoarchaeota archaeon]|nr:hypothetical protein [Nanoarchaeota archaeon]